MEDLKKQLLSVTKLTLITKSEHNSKMAWSGQGQAEVETASEQKANQTIITLTETGRFTYIDTNYTSSFYNSFQFMIDSQVVKLFHLRFGQCTPVYLFDLYYTEQNKFISISPHLCGQDCYYGKITLLENGLDFQWIIKGPRKQEHLVYHYR